MRVLFNQTEEDIIEYSLYQQLETPKRKVYKLILQFFPTILFFILIWIITPFQNFDFEEFPYIMFILIGLLGISPILFMPYFIKKLIVIKNKAFLENKENDVLLGKRIIELNDIGLIVVTEKNQGVIEWRKDLKIVETKNLMLLYINSESAFIIPKRAFETTQEYEKFKEKTKTLIDKTLKENILHNISSN